MVLRTNLLEVESIIPYEIRENVGAMNGSKCLIEFLPRPEVHVNLPSAVLGVAEGFEPDPSTLLVNENVGMETLIVTAAVHFFISKLTPATLSTMRLVVGRNKFRDEFEEIKVEFAVVLGLDDFLHYGEISRSLHSWNVAGDVMIVHYEVHRKLHFWCDEVRRVGKAKLERQ